jgi:hypothetical protein
MARRARQIKGRTREGARRDRSCECRDATTDREARGGSGNDDAARSIVVGVDGSYTTVARGVAGAHEAEADGGPGAGARATARRTSGGHRTSGINDATSRGVVQQHALWLWTGWESRRAIVGRAEVRLFTLLWGDALLYATEKEQEDEYRSEAPEFFMASVESMILASRRVRACADGCGPRIEAAEARHGAVMQTGELVRNGDRRQGEGLAQCARAGA